MKTSGAWLPADKVIAAATATIEAIKTQREERAQALATGKWFAPTLEHARQTYGVRLFAGMREGVALDLRRIAEAAAKLPVPNVFVSADDFSAIARQWDKTTP